jgi:hypothetical protein
MHTKRRILNSIQCSQWLLKQCMYVVGNEYHILFDFDFANLQSYCRADL